MASIPATFVGQAYLSGVGVTPQAAVNITLVGELFYSGVGVGGGPLPGGPGLGFWGGVSPPMPGHDLPPAGVGIWPSPGRPDQGLPPSGVGVWPSPGHPDNTLPVPQPPTEPPGGSGDDNGFIKPPQEGQPSWSFHEQYGWGYYPGDTTAGPKK
jgi:hypothetical protein